MTGTPGKGSQEKGEIALQAAVEDLAEQIRIVKKDTAVPAKQKEFYRRVREVREGK